ncbi:hypothetical protein FQN49_000562 [Arthroderma sp. PD_2]|nr:hypothetical protein FQN49_000562 [Arthroderma sp. PD_2]
MPSRAVAGLQYSTATGRATGTSTGIPASKRRAVQRGIAGQTGLAGQRRGFSHVSARRQEEESRFKPEDIQRESDEVDVCIVGGGPAGLCAAIQLKKLANDAGNEDFRVLLLEKAGEIGDHIVSGNVLQPTAINELLPDWLSEDNPNRFEHATPVTSDKMRFLTEKYTIPIPAPPQMNNHGNYIISLSHARVTLFDERCLGSMTKRVMKKFDLRRDCQPQTYGIGIKEVWEVQPEKFQKGEAVHTMGYPLPKDTYGGSFMYHFGENMVSVGLTVGLDYPNPWLSPYNEFQKLKQHPLFRNVLEGGTCIAYAGRALIEGGFQSIPKCAFPGGALIGDSAGFMNVPKVKGTHTSMLSGMLAAKATYSALSGGSSDGTIFLYEYEDALRSSTIWSELKEVRNMRPSFPTRHLRRYHVQWVGSVYSSWPRSMDPQAPRYRLGSHQDGKRVVSRTGTNHEEDQPVHLQVADWEKHTAEAWPKWQGVENRFCPAGVYEYIEDKDKPHGVRFQINAQNCIHCKTCDIKVPTQDINWQTPQGGEGPKYSIT